MRTSILILTVVLSLGSTAPAPAGLMRLITAMAPVKLKETVEGVKVYRAYSKMKAFGPPGVPPPPAKTVEHEPSLAMMPGYLFLGSHQAVKDCILRAKGKIAG